MNPIATLVVLMSVCLVAPAWAASEETEQAIAASKAAYDEVDAVGFAWRDTAKIIKMAEEAAAEGDDDRAQQLADMARFQSEAALAQSKRSPEALPGS